MKTLTRDNTSLVIFWTLHQRSGYSDTRYKRTQRTTEFPPETDPEEAIEAILKEHGRVTETTTAGRPTLRYASIGSHQIIHPHERGQITAWTASEQGLFDGQEWQKCISHKPE